MIRELNKMTWCDVEALNREKTYFLFPVGSVEQHGPHLPLGTDDLILTNVLSGVLESEDTMSGELDVDGKEANILCLPPLLFGNSHEHYSFPGTISLSCNTLVSILEDVLASISEHGFNKLIVFNSHGGNTDLIKAYSQEWEQRFSVKVFLISLWSSLYGEGDEPSIFISDANVDIHAGERESSLLMHYEVESVKSDLICSDISRDVSFKPFYSGWQTDEISTGNGTLGYPEHASKEKGAEYARFLVERTIEIVNMIINE